MLTDVGSGVGVGVAAEAGGDAGVRVADGDNGVAQAVAVSTARTGTRRRRLPAAERADPVTDILTVHLGSGTRPSLFRTPQGAERVSGD